jgi:hypothetical protein
MHARRPRYGFYVDHVLAACGSVFLFAGPAASGFMSERVAVVYWWPIGSIQYLVFDVGGTIGIAGMTVALVWSIVKHTGQLYRAERIGRPCLAYGVRDAV